MWDDLAFDWLDVDDFRKEPKKYLLRLLAILGVIALVVACLLLSY